jgi:hypothetical protein
VITGTPCKRDNNNGPPAASMVPQGRESRYV